METPTYNLGNLVAEAKTQLPQLVQERSNFLPGFKGSERIPARMRLAVQLRGARLFGCPVCAKLFPPIATREGLSPEDIANIASGDTADLDEDVHAAVTWASAVIDNDGEAPDEVPEAALALSEQQRGHLQYMIRVERLVHATGLMFLPNSWIARTAGA